VVRRLAIAVIGSAFLLVGVAEAQVAPLTPPPGKVSATEVAGAKRLVLHSHGKTVPLNASRYCLPPVGAPGPLGSLSFPGYVEEYLIKRCSARFSSRKSRTSLPVHSEALIEFTTPVAIHEAGASFRGPRHCPTAPATASPLDATRQRWVFRVPFSVHNCPIVRVSVVHYPLIANRGNYRSWFSYNAGFEGRLRTHRHHRR